MIDLGDVFDYLSDVSLLLPGVVISIALALLLGRRLGVRLGRGRLAGSMLVLAVGLIISATLTPSREAIDFGTLGSGVCDLSRIRLAPLHEVLALHDAGFNVLLYVPLGIALGALLGRPSAPAVIAAGLALSPVIELLQMVIRQLDRACQASDMIDNLSGLAIGLALAAVFQLLAWWVRRSPA